MMKSGPRTVHLLKIYLLLLRTFSFQSWGFVFENQPFVIYSSLSTSLVPKPSTNIIHNRLQRFRCEKFEDSEVKPIEKVELSNEKIYEMIELTFIKACFQLATGYVDMLKLFLAATNAAYDRGIPLPTLINGVDGCGQNSANRDLTKDETDVRSSWLTISYLTLETIDRIEGTNKLNSYDIPESFKQKYSHITNERVREEFKLADTGHPSDDGGNHDDGNHDDSQENDPQTTALMPYNMQIISLTISNLKEARLSEKKYIDEDEIGPPRPNIPGT